MERGFGLGDRWMSVAVGVSLVLHVGLGIAVMGRRGRPLSAQVEVAKPVEQADRWSGNSPFVGGGDRLVDVDPGVATGAPAAPEVPEVPATPVPAAAKERAPAAKAEVQEHAARERTAAVAPSISAASSARAASPRKASRGQAGEGDDGGGVHPGTFGSEGPAGIRSVGRAFTRAIPPACQGDAIWGSITPGTHLEAEVTLFVDAAGHIERTAFAKRDVPPALASLLRRTLPLIESNTLSVRGGAVVKGSERLRLSVTVSDATGRASDELDFPFFEGGHGKASFSQPSGRHVEVDVKVMKVEVAGE